MRPSTRQDPPLFHRDGKRSCHLFLGLVDRILAAGRDLGSPSLVLGLHARELLVGSRSVALEPLSLLGLGCLTERPLNRVSHELHPRNRVGEVLPLRKPLRLHHPNGPTLFFTREVHQCSNLGRLAGRSSRTRTTVVKPPVLEVRHAPDRRVGDKKAIRRADPANQEPVEEVAIPV